MNKVLRYSFYNIRHLRQSKSPSWLSNKSYATETKEKEIDLNEPVKYFGSKAATWQAKTTRSGRTTQGLWFQPYVISASLTVFLIYFCVLREENDVDEELSKTLYERIDGLEEKQLILAYRYNKEHNMDVSDIVNRLNELGLSIDKP